MPQHRNAYRHASLRGCARQIPQADALADRLHWQADEPFPPTLGRVVATRLGNGGQPGTARPKGVRKFMLEFKGPALADIPFGVKPEVVLSASRGSFFRWFFEDISALAST